MQDNTTVPQEWWITEQGLKKNMMLPGNIPIATISDVIVPAIFSRAPGLVALQSTRNGGVSEGVYSTMNLGNNTEDSRESVQQNMMRLCQRAFIDGNRMVSSIQVHGTEVLLAVKPGKYHGYDAFITNQENLFLSVFTADCHPILLYDPRHNASGAVHAGWKGAAGEIVTKTIHAMQKSFGSIPAECLAYTGTGISAEAYEVGREVASAFPEDCSRRSLLSPGNEKYQLNLGMVIYRQLLNAGIPALSIEQSPFCSFYESRLFYSHRRDHGRTGRMVSLIGFNSKHPSTKTSCHKSHRVHGPDEISPP